MSRVGSRKRYGWIFACALAVGCAPAASAPPARNPAASGPESPKELQRLSIGAMPLAPLSGQEQALEKQLRDDVAEVLSAGERHTGNEWGLAVVTDNLAARLEAQGLLVEREGFVGADGALGQNLIVNLRGTQLGGEVVLVGARFDSVPGSPGADDNATGVAALLALARTFKAQPRARTLQLVWFSDASKRQTKESMGAWQHLQHVGNRKPGDDPEAAPVGALRACVELHGLGAFNEAPNSQGYPDGMPAGHPIGEFVEVVSMAQDNVLGTTLSEAMGHASSVPVKSVTVLEPESGAAMTGFRAFAEHHCPAALVSDTQKRRFPGFGTAEDTAERLDFGRLARAVHALEAGIAALVNPPPPAAETQVAGPLPTAEASP